MVIKGVTGVPLANVHRFTLKPLTAIMLQVFWCPTNRCHNFRLYLKLPFPRFNNIILCASGRYLWSDMDFNNSEARWVPRWSWPESYKSRSKSGDRVLTFDPPIPSNRAVQWWLAKNMCSGVCVTSWYVSFNREGFIWERCPNQVAHTCTAERHSERWWPLI